MILAACETAAGTPDVVCESNPGAAGHVCTVYSGPGLAMTCVVGTLVPSCPTANVLGTCSYSLPAGGITEGVKTTYYSDGMVSAATAQMQCTAQSGATWALGP